MKNFTPFSRINFDISRVSEKFLSAFLMIASEKNPFSRQNVVGHITSSGLVIRNDQALLIFHPFIKKWMQPGGHIDENENPIEAAIREVQEETGAICRPFAQYLDPIDIDFHEIPDNPKKSEGRHLHVDLLFLLEVVNEEDAPEGIQKAWLPLSKISNHRLRRALVKLGYEI